MNESITGEEAYAVIRGEARRHSVDDTSLDWEDIAQEAMIMWLRVPNGRVLDHPKAYLRRIVRNTAHAARITALEKSAQYTYRASTVPELIEQVLSMSREDMGDKDMVDLVARRADLCEAVKLLSPASRALLRHRFLEPGTLTAADRGKLRRTYISIARYMNSYKGMSPVGSRRACSNRAAYYKTRHQEHGGT